MQRPTRSLFQSLSMLGALVAITFPAAASTQERAQELLTTVAVLLVAGAVVAVCISYTAWLLVQSKAGFKNRLLVMGVVDLVVGASAAFSAMRSPNVADALKFIPPALVLLGVGVAALARGTSLPPAP